MVERALISIQPARLPQELESTAQLFAAYSESLGLHLLFPHFDTEAQVSTKKTCSSDWRDLTGL